MEYTEDSPIGLLAMIRAMERKVYDCELYSDLRSALLDPMTVAHCEYCLFNNIALSKETILRIKTAYDRIVTNGTINKNLLR